MLMADAIAHSLYAEGVRVVANVPDEVTIFLAQAFDAMGIRVVRARHEHSAVLIADGYSRATGDVGVAVVGHGPGLTQALSALVTARKRGSKLLVLVGSVRPDLPTHPKVVDERRLVEATGSIYRLCSGESDLLNSLARALYEVQHSAPPVVLCVGTRSTLLKDFRPTEQAVGNPQPVSPLAIKPHYDPIAVGDIVAALANARFPIIFAGRGAVASGADAALVRLADMSGALLATSLLARGMFEGHPRDVGVLGTFATEAVPELLANCDCLLAFGVSLNYFQTGGGRPINGRIIHVESDPLNLRSFQPTDLGVVGDASAIATATIELLEQSEVRINSRWDALEIGTGVGVDMAIEEESADGVNSSPMSTDRFLAAMNKILPDNRAVVCDGGFFMNFVVDRVSVPGPGMWFWTLDFASIGLGLGISIGVALALKESRVVLFVGDGGLSMSMQELETVVREEVPLLIVVLNNGAYESERNYLLAHSQPAAQSEFPPIDFASLGAALGMKTRKVSSQDDLLGLRQLLDDSPGPFLLDARVASGYHRSRSRYT